MMNLDNTSTFIAPLGASVHRLAEQVCKHQANSQVAKQVYLNTLAVSAVQFYLNCMGIETDRDTSQSVDPVMQALLDVADLNLPGLGRLECRPVLPDAQTVGIPAEVWCDRIGYVAVQFDSALKTAKLLGFTSTVDSEEMPIHALRSLDELMEHLRQLKPIEHQVVLSHWLQGIVESGWRSLDELIGEMQPLILSFRTDISTNQPTTRRAKLLDLAVQLGKQPVVLLVAITPEIDQQLGISVQVHPVGETQYLPIDLTLKLLAKTGEVLQEVRSRQQDNFVQLKRFRGLPGERFDLQVTLGDDVSVTESFVI